MHELDVPLTRPFILVAEDEPDALRLVTFHLKRHGYRVGCAADGLEALNNVFEAHPDLLVLDRMMPKLDGLEVCRLLRNRPLARGLPILMLTARAGQEDQPPPVPMTVQPRPVGPLGILKRAARRGGPVVTVL